MANAAILLAAGRNRRMQNTVDDKILAPVAGRPALLYSFDAFVQSGVVDTVCIVYRDDAQCSVIESILPATRLRVVYAMGGAERQDSVLSALECLPAQDLVFVHDCARPLILPQTIRDLADQAARHGAAACARPVTDTIKMVEDTGLRDLPRSQLRAMETPQVFRHSTLLKAYRRIEADELHVTDDAAAAALLNIHPVLIEAPGPNLKITLPGDIQRVEQILNERQGRAMAQQAAFRIGHGYDIHRFAEGRLLILGGVHIPHHLGLEGHSDADCLSHAIADAILGAAGLRDIGFYYPPGKPETAGMDSLKIVAGAVAEARKKGLQPVNVDATLIAQQPKVGPYVEAMKERLSQVMGIPPSAIGVKATTNEGIGGLGRSEGIAAHAVCLLTSVA